TPAVRWLLGCLLLLALLVGLWFVQKYFELDNRLPDLHPGVQPFWLPLLVLTLLVICAAGWWVWRRSFRPPPPGSQYPHIHAAWEEAVGALYRAGINVRKDPLFLVLGKPSGSEEALFQESDLTPLVGQVPQRADAPLHVYAFRDKDNSVSVYVTCAGASLF